MVLWLREKGWKAPRAIHRAQSSSVVSEMNPHMSEPTCKQQRRKRGAH